MKKIVMLLALLTVSAHSMLAFAQDAAPAAAPASSAAMPNLDNSSGLTDGAKWVWDMVVNGHWWPAAAGLLIIAVWVARKYGAKYLPFLATDKGGALLALGTAMLGAVLNAVIAGTAFDMKAVMTALGVGFAAGGGWSMLRKIMGMSNAAAPPATPSEPVAPIELPPAA